MLVSGNQPAGTANPPSGILRETRDHKSECYTAHTRTEENTKHFQSFHWKNPYSQQQYSEQFFNKITNRQLGIVVSHWRKLIIGLKTFKVMCMQGNLVKKFPSENIAKGSDLSCYCPETVVDIEDTWQEACFRSTWNLRSLMKGPEIPFRITQLLGSMEKLDS